MTQHRATHGILARLGGAPYWTAWCTTCDWVCDERWPLDVDPFSLGGHDSSGTAARAHAIAPDGARDILTALAEWSKS
jgi:hypothetical protein